ERVTEMQHAAFAETAAMDITTGSPGAELAEYAASLTKRERKQARKVERAAAYRALEKRVPPLAAGASVVLAAMLVFKGLDNVGLDISLGSALLMLTMLALGVWMATTVFARALKKQSISRATFIIFSWLQVFTACAFAFSHGANDIANAVGPFAAVLDVLRTGTLSQEAAVPAAVLIAFGIALISGLWFVGRNVIHTVGTGLTAMHPSSGFAAELAAATVVLLASVLGLPVSSTHILIGAVLGVGIVNRAANWKLMRPIFLAWVLTLPAAASIGAIVVLVLRSIFCDARSRSSRPGGHLATQHTQDAIETCLEGFFVARVLLLPRHAEAPGVFAVELGPSSPPRLGDQGGPRRGGSQAGGGLQRSQPVEGGVVPADLGDHPAAFLLPATAALTGGTHTDESDAPPFGLPHRVFDLGRLGPVHGARSPPQEKDACALFEEGHTVGEQHRHDRPEREQRPQQKPPDQQLRPGRGQQLLQPAL